VADKRHIKANIKQLQRIKTWQLLILLIIIGFLTATFLRLNNIGMVQRRDAVLAADKTGDEANMMNRLLDLQQYSAQHMNSSTGPFYLEQQFRRDAQKLVDAAKNDDNPNGNINVKAEAVCKPQYTVWSPAYVQCFTDELAKYPPSPDPVQNVKLPSTALYRYDFDSPVWSSDFAGWSSFVFVAICLLIIGRLASLGILHLMLKHHYRGV
jgi:hypothetical protein